MNELALFAGAGGGILGGHLLGWRTVCAVEWEPYAACVLAQRQNDGILPPCPIWDDVQTFDGRPWRGIVDVVSGGFPCQDISVAGKGAGITGARSGMWGHMARIIGEVRPRFVFVENSPALLTRGLGVVLGDLAAFGYDCRWAVMGAADVGAPHQRDRFWLVAHSTSEQHQGSPQAKRREASTELSRADMANTSSQRHELTDEALRTGRHASQPYCEVADTDSLRELQPKGCVGDLGRRSGHGGEEVPNANGWGGLPWGLGREQCASSGEETRERIRALWASEPDVGRMAHGVAARVDRLKAIGNGQVPLCAAEAFRILSADFI